MRSFTLFTLVILLLAFHSCKPNTAVQDEKERVARREAEQKRKEHLVDSLFNVVEDKAMIYTYYERMDAVSQLRRIIPEEEERFIRIELELARLQKESME